MGTRISRLVRGSLYMEADGKTGAAAVGWEGWVLTSWSRVLSFIKAGCMRRRWPKGKHHRGKHGKYGTTGHPDGGE